MPHPDARSAVLNDNTDFYGRQYYESYLVEKYGFPTLSERAVNDLPERCLHWLRYLLRYAPPPARLLEVGSAHGGFVALLRAAGFDATGLELSPFVVDFARRAFQVPVLLGPIEQQNLPACSFNAIPVMDVLEHLADPLGTIRQCIRLLVDDGILALQTPCYPEGKSYKEMVRENASFLKMLSPEQHLFLFSRTSVRRLLEQAGMNHVRFERAIFEEYDMFLFAGRQPLMRHRYGEVRAALHATSSGRLVEPMLVLDARLRRLSGRLAIAEADRASRLSIIQEQGCRLGEVTGERNRLGAELAQIRELYDAAEADRQARMAVILEQGRRLGELDGRCNHVSADLAKLQELYSAAEADRDARLAVILDQGRRLGELAGERNRLAETAIAIRGQHETCRAEWASRERTLIEQARRSEELLRKQLAEMEATCRDNAKHVREAQDRILDITEELRSARALVAAVRRSWPYRLLRATGLLRITGDQAPAKTVTRP